MNKNFRFSVIINFILIGIIAGLSAGFLLFRSDSVVKSVEAGKSDLIDMQFTFRRVAQEVLPVVVEIRVVEKRIQIMPEGYSWPFNFMDPEKEDGNDPKQQEFETEGLGSGIIVKKDGNKYFVLTNNHVIGEADQITVRLNDKTEINADIIGIDDRKDLALIAFESDKSLRTARLGDSDNLSIGDLVLAVGSPLGYDSTVTAGIVSAIGRAGPENNISDFIQTDASMNQGNSGGALVNLDGEVVGINNWIATTTGVSIGLGFSIPVNNVKQAIDDFISDGSVQYGWLGVTIANPDKTTAEQLKITGKKGALVYNVYDNSPADESGIKPGDYIIRLNETTVNDYMHFTRLVGDIRAGHKISITLIRAGKQIEIEALIGLRKEKAQLIKLSDNIWPGFTALPLDEDLKKDFGLSNDLNGLIISVEPASRAHQAGLRDYDIILEINDVVINNMMDFYRIINDNNNRYVFKLIRNNQEILVELII